MSSCDRTARTLGEEDVAGVFVPRLTEVDPVELQAATQDTTAKPTISGDAHGHHRHAIGAA